MSIATAPPRPELYDKAVALVLQGGGALGSYQAGVFEALAHPIRQTAVAEASTW